MINNEIRFNVSSDEIAMMTDEDLAANILHLGESLTKEKDVKLEKQIEMELSWYIRESQIREVRRAANEKWLRTSPYVSE